MISMRRPLTRYSPRPRNRSVQALGGSHLSLTKVFFGLNAPASCGRATSAPLRREDGEGTFCGKLSETADKPSLPHGLVTLSDAAVGVRGELNRRRTSCMSELIRSTNASSRKPLCHHRLTPSFNCPWDTTFFGESCNSHLYVSSFDFGRQRSGKSLALRRSL